jgi:hypothetical protein
MSENRPFEPAADRPRHRLTSLYALDCDAGIALDARISELPLSFGRLERFYRGASTQTPNVLHFADYAAGEIELGRSDRLAAVSSGAVWLFRLPYGRLVAGLSIDFSADLEGTIAILEDSYYTDLSIAGTSLIACLRGCDPALTDALADASLASHSHQLLFLGSGGRDFLPSGRHPFADRRRHDLLQRLVYRADLPYQRRHSQIHFPPEPNRRPGAVVAVSPYVSVAAGQQDYIENGMFLSAVQAVGSAHLVARIRSDAYSALDSLRRFESAEVRLRTRRQRLGMLSDRLSQLELELSFGVEAYENLGSLVPSLRLTEFHRSLFRALEIPEEAGTTGNMLERLSKALSAASSSVRFSERRHDDQRRLKWSVAAGFISLLAITLGIAFGFFGSSVSEVNRRDSIFSWGHYRGLYLFIAGVVLAGVLIFLLTWLFTAWDERRDERHPPDTG